MKKKKNCIVGTLLLRYTEDTNVTCISKIKINNKKKVGI